MHTFFFAISNSIKPRTSKSLYVTKSILQVINIFEKILLQSYANPPLDIKLDAIRRCFEKSERIKYVSEDIGYSRSSIYRRRKRYLKEDILGITNHKNIPLQKLGPNITQAKTEFHLLRK